MEVWKDISGYEGYYQVSNLGKIKSLSRKISYISKEKILRSSIKRDGYSICVLYNEKKKFTPIIHRIVAKTFIVNPSNKPEVNHINGIRHDNRVENLEWVTSKENVNKSIISGRWSNRLIPVVQINILGEFLNKFISVADAERSTGIKSSNIYACLKNKSKTAGGFIWK